jgi:hypothetical protein
MIGWTSVRCNRGMQRHYGVTQGCLSFEEMAVFFVALVESVLAYQIQARL